MGKRKSSKPPPKKQRPKLATTFACPFCNSDNSVFCQFDRARDIGTVTCNACQVLPLPCWLPSHQTALQLTAQSKHARNARKFQRGHQLGLTVCAYLSQSSYTTKVTKLSEPIDVYSGAVCLILRAGCSD